MILWTISIVLLRLVEARLNFPRETEPVPTGSSVPSKVVFLLPDGVSDFGDLGEGEDDDRPMSYSLAQGVRTRQAD